MVIFCSAIYLSCSFVHGHDSFGGSVNVSVLTTEKAMCSNCATDMSFDTNSTF
jgi:hypothetical protein